MKANNECRTSYRAKLVQNIILIWLDEKNGKSSSTSCRNIIKQLQCVVNAVFTFKDRKKCINFIKEINEKTCIIISDSLCEQVVPLIHNIPQVDSILIFCRKKSSNQQWIRKWCKVKGTFNEISTICKTLKQIAHVCEHNSIGFSVIDTANGAVTSNKSLDLLDPNFIYMQIVKEILLTVRFNPYRFQNFINDCNEQFAGNKAELENIKRFEFERENKSSIYWYTSKCFLYSMLNRALRTMDFDMLTSMAFFIADLHCRINQLYSEQSGNDNYTRSTFEVYRGQGILRKEFEKIQNARDGLLSFNNFLSASESPTKSSHFAHRVVQNPDMVGVLFVMTINPSLSSMPFAIATEFRHFQDVETDILFPIHTIFRIMDIRVLDENRTLFQVNLFLVHDNDPDLFQLINYIHKETFPDAEGWYRLGLVLIQQRKFVMAKEFFSVLLRQTTGNSERAFMYHQLGRIKYEQGEFRQAIQLYEKSLDIYKATLSPTHVCFAYCYNNIGLAYAHMGEHSKALSCHEKALNIRFKNFPPNHISFANSYYNMALVYNSMGEHSKSLSWHEKALEIRQATLPSYHPDLAMSYNDIGMAYRHMGKCLTALSWHEKALDIRQQTLYPNHPNLAQTYNNMGNVYFDMGDYSKALSFYNISLHMKENSLPPEHPLIELTKTNIGNTKKKL